MFNRILYWFVTLPSLLKAGCAATVGLLFACSCLFVASLPGAYAEGVAMQTATAQAAQDQATQIAIAAAGDATATSIAEVTATSAAEQAATATRVTAIERITATALAAPTQTAQAYLDATSTSIAALTATAQGEIDATYTAIAAATEQAAATAQAQAQAEQATATALAQAAEQAATEQAIAQATTTIEDYRRAMPKGYWLEMDGRIGVAVGDFRYENTARYESSGPNAEFVAFYIGVYNESGGTIHVNPHNVTLVDLDGRTYAHHGVTYTYWQEPLQAINVPSGNRAEGGMVFLIDQDSAPAQIIYDTGGFFGGSIIVDLRRPPDETQ